MTSPITIITSYYHRCYDSTVQWLLHFTQLRYYSSWKNSLHSGHTSIDDQRPWITFGAFAALQAYLRPQMSVFEWGSGGSTLYFNNHAQQVISIEHDAAWFQTVATLLKQAPEHHTTYQLIPPDAAGETIPTGAVPFTSADEHYVGLTFFHYASAIRNYPDANFDLIIVDGRARVACLAEAWNKLKIGGILVLDNSDRAAYEVRVNVFGKYIRKNYYGPGPYNKSFWQTSLFTKLA